MPLFDDDHDYAAFERVMTEALERLPDSRLLGYCLMPNHWHLVLWPKEDGLLSEFMRWLTVTHTQRWHAHRQSAGTGPIYQGRFKSFPIQQDAHLLTVLRYVERNALRSDLVRRAENWRWGSLWRWDHRQQAAGKDAGLPPLSGWPIARPRPWKAMVNQPLGESEIARVRRSVKRGAPYGEKRWAEREAERLGLESTLRPRGRPRK